MVSEVSSVKFFNQRPIIFHYYMVPFAILYGLWAVVCGNVFESFSWELTLIGVAVIAVLQVLCSLFCMWSVDFYCLATCSEVAEPGLASLVKVNPIANSGYCSLEKLHRERSGRTYFEYQKLVYDVKKTASNEITLEPLTFPDQLSFAAYTDAKGFATEEEVAVVAKKYKLNKLNMDIPKFTELFQERATAPFFVFQVFCVGLWCLDEYWYYSLFTLFMLVVFECTLVQQQLRNMSEIRKMGNKPYRLNVYRQRRWRPLGSEQLLPGDIVSVGRSNNDRLVPCDILLLRGSCIVDESMLTGESVPVMKESVEQLPPSDKLNNEVNGKLHILYGGTKVVQHTPPPKGQSGLKSTDNGCIGYVLRTGFNTSQGRLLKTILFGVKQVTANNLETFLFILFLLVFAVVAAGYVWIKGTEDPRRNRYKLFLDCTLILTSVVPPELPIELSLAVNTSLLALSKLFIFCTEPFRIPFAGRIDVCCFDKTGTLTSDCLVVEGVAGLPDVDASHDQEDVNKRALKIRPVSRSPDESINVMATCHSLVELDSQLIGDPLEKATLEAIEWTLTRGDAVLPARSTRDGRLHGWKIYQRFFSTALLRSLLLSGELLTVVLCHQAPGTVEPLCMAYVKGAPEMVKNMLSNVPSFYDETYLTLARRGARVLTLAYRSLGNLSHQAIRDVTRSDCERNLKFAGFVIISCPLKTDSPNAVQEILRASHHVVMITGDNPLTACHVARQLDIVHRPTTLVLSHPDQHSDRWHWRSVDDSVSVDLEEFFQSTDVRNDVYQYDLCVTGEGIEHVTQSTGLNALLSLLPHVTVFARATPKQKEFIVTSYKDMGFVTLMCGDGTNDVGALKHAHCGVALLTSGEISTASNRRKPGPPSKANATPTPSTGTSKTSQQVKGSSTSGNPHRGPSRQERGSNTSGSSNAAGSSQRQGGSQRAAHTLQQLMEQIEEEQEAQVVRLGDASIASPFTSKLSTPKAVCDIIKQGRCTLVTTLQMFKILALNALIFAYSQSVLFLNGVKFSDMQATLHGLLLAACFLFICRSKPLQVLSRTRPLPNIFNAYTLLTVVLQFAIHFSCLVYLYNGAKVLSPPLNETIAYLREKAQNESLAAAANASQDGSNQSTSGLNSTGENQTEEFDYLYADFEPSLINSTVYLISIAMQVATVAVNYKGHPFMERLTENKPLLYSIIGAFLATFALASGAMPDVADQFEIVPLPDDFRPVVLAVLAIDLMGSFFVDRLLEIICGYGSQNVGVRAAAWWKSTVTAASAGRLGRSSPVAAAPPAKST